MNHFDNFDNFISFLMQNDVSGLLAYSLKVCMSLMQNKKFRNEVLVDKARGSKEGSAGYKISSDVDVNLVWRDPSSKDDQLIQLAVRRSNHSIKYINKKTVRIIHMIYLTTHTFAWIGSKACMPTLFNSKRWCVCSHELIS